jgi:predicted DsbA family dithiol-disulfide isomerase
MAMPPHLRRGIDQGAGARLREMAAASGREIVFSDWIPNSRRALEASEFARQAGKHDSFHRTVFRKYYGEGQDIGDWAVLRAAAREVGLDGAEMQTQTERGLFSAIVTRHRQEAQALGISGVPAYILGNRYLIMGAQPFSVFAQAMARLEAEG